LHLVGILFPHINDNARSKSHQISTTISFFLASNSELRSHEWYQSSSE